MPRSLPAYRLLAGLTLALACAPAATAQLYAGLSGGYARVADVPRYGVGVSFYIPAFDHALDVVPSFDFYYRKWNARPTEVGTVWAANLDTRLNLPPILRIVRPYAGVGISLIGVDSPTRLGLNLTAGTFFRLFVRDVYPYAQVSYHVAEEFDAVNLLDTVFVQTGVRFALF